MHRPTGKSIHTRKQVNQFTHEITCILEMLKAKCSPMPARTIYPHVAGLCRRLGTWRPKTERPLHSQEQTNKQSNVPFTSLGGVCVCACGSDQTVAVLGSTGPRRSFIQTDRTQPSAASTSGGRLSISRNLRSTSPIADLVVIYPTTGTVYL